MSDPVLISPGGGEIVGDAPDRRVEILSDHEALHATWSRFGPGREGADLHVHHHHTDLFFVLDGELTLRLGIDKDPVAVPAGTLARVPPLVVHGFRNGSEADVRYLNLHAPGRGFAEFMRALRDGRSLSYDQHPPPADGGRPPTDAVIGGDLFVAEGDGSRVALLADVDEIAISQMWIDPGASSPPRHLHRRHVESFYVLDGEITFTVGSSELRADAGSWLQVPPGMPHTFAVTGDRAARFVDVHTPSCGFGRFVRGVHEAGTEDEQAAAQAAFDEVSV